MTGAMAIIFQFNVMLARKAEIDHKYPGGLPQFRCDWLVRPVERWCEDEHLLAFTSMGPYFQEVAARLISFGIDVLQTNETIPPAEIVSRCDWLDWDVHHRTERKLPGGSSFAQEVIQYWLKGTEPGEVAHFERRKHCP
jgi:hypothetical protein